MLRRVPEFTRRQRLTSLKILSQATPGQTVTTRTLKTILTNSAVADLKAASPVQAGARNNATPQDTPPLLPYLIVLLPPLPNLILVWGLTLTGS